MYLQEQGRDNTVESFYWIQFEHFLPSNDRTYNYASKNTTQIGDLHFASTTWEAGLAIGRKWQGNPASGWCSQCRRLA